MEKIATSEELINSLKGKGVSVNNIPLDSLTRREFRTLGRWRYRVALHLLSLLQQEGQEISSAKVSVEKAEETAGPGYRIKVILNDGTIENWWVPRSEAKFYREPATKIKKEEEYLEVKAIKERPELFPRLFPEGRLARLETGKSVVYDLWWEPFSSRIIGSIEISLDEIVPATLQFSNTPIIKVKTPPKGRDVAEELFKLLILKKIRSSRRQELLTQTQQELLWKLRIAVEQKQPVKFTWLGFPFKNPDELVTYRVLPDLNEIMGLAQLIRISKTVQQIYPPGISWTILWEGNAYKDILNIPDGNVQLYLKEVEGFIRKFKWDKEIKLIDLASIVHQHPGFKELFQEQTEKVLKGKVSVNELRKFFPVMAKAINKRREMDFPVMSDPPEGDNIFASYDKTRALEILEATKIFFNESNLHLRKKITEIALEKAIKYMVFHWTKDRLGIIPAWIDDTTAYVSVTDKVGRYAFHFPKENTYLPHHGVPLLPRKTKHFELSFDESKLVEALFEWANVQLVYLSSVGAELVQVFVREDSEYTPFFFLC